MHFRRRALLLLLVVVATAGAFDSALVGAYTSTAVADDAGALWINPAGLGIARMPNLYFSLAGLEDDWEDYSGAVQLGILGLGYRRVPGAFEDDYHGRFSLGLGLGGERFSLGLGFDWFNERLGRLEETVFDMRLGVLWRPWSFLSVGGTLENLLSADTALERRDNVLAAGIALRPLAPFLFDSPDLVTLSFDARYTADPEDLIDNAEQLDWFAGVELRPLDGLALTAGYDDDGSLTVGARLELTHGVFGYGGALDDTGDFTRHGGSVAFSLERHEPLVCFAPPGVLTLEIGGGLDDLPPEFSLLGGPGGGQSLTGLLSQLKRAREDADVDAVLLSIKPLGGIFGEVTGSMQELGAEIDLTRAAGLPVYAVFTGEAVDPGALYLAAHCERIFLPAFTSVDGLGTALTINRYGGLAEKYGVDLQVITAGEYKSGFWSLTKGATTEQARAISELLADNQEQLYDLLGERRELSREELLALADTWTLRSEEALEAGLVDELGDYRDALAAVARAAGAEAASADEVRVVGTAGREYWEDEWSGRPRIAIVGAYGGISVGRSGWDYLRGGRGMGSHTLAEQLDKARRDPLVRAVVLRIDSGGGSGIASEEIARAVTRLTEAGKPVIASIADIAASGGYWIACPADWIIAEPASFTGSIGVIGVMASLERLFEEQGIVHESYTEGRYGNLGDYGRSLTDEERAMVEEELNYFYGVFVDKVAAERELEVDEVYEIAGGRVWTGRQALDNGLIDELGGLRRAVELAARRGGVDHPDPDLVTYGNWGPMLFELLDRDLIELLGYGDTARVDLDF